MSKYTIKFNYKTVTIEVEGDFRQEGDALDKAWNCWKILILKNLILVKNEIKY